VKRGGDTGNTTQHKRYLSNQEFNKNQQFIVSNVKNSTSFPVLPFAFTCTMSYSFSSTNKRVHRYKL